MRRLFVLVACLALVACGEKSETISVYSIDGASGALKLLKQYPGGKGANWVEIVSFD